MFHPHGGAKVSATQIQEPTYSGPFALFSNQLTFVSCPFHPLVSTDQSLSVSLQYSLIKYTESCDKSCVPLNVLRSYKKQKAIS